MEVQAENPPAPAPVHPQFDSAFYNRTDRAVTAIEEMLPLFAEMIAERKAAKERENFSFNNPVVSPSVSAPQVPVVAPQDPGPAPGPSHDAFVPLPSTSGLQQPPQHAVASPRGRSSEGVTQERSRHASPSLQDRLRLHIDDVKRQLSNTMEIDDLYRSQGRLPPHQVSRDVGYLQDRLSQLQSSLADSMASSLGVPTSTSAHAVASPAPAPVASGRQPLASVAVMIGATSSELLLATSVPLVEDPVPGNHRKRRLFIHPRGDCRHQGGRCRLVEPPRLRRGEAPLAEPLRLLGDEVHLVEPPRLLGGRPSVEPLRLGGELPPRGLPDRRRGRLGTPSLLAGAHLLQRDNVVRRGTLSLLQYIAPLGPPPGNLHWSDQDHGLLMATLLLQKRKRKLKTHRFRPQ